MQRRHKLAAAGLAALLCLAALLAAVQAKPAAVPDPYRQTAEILLATYGWERDPQREIYSSADCGLDEFMGVWAAAKAAGRPAVLQNAAVDMDSCYVMEEGLYLSPAAGLETDQVRYYRIPVKNPWCSDAPLQCDIAFYKGGRLPRPSLRRPGGLERRTAQPPRPGAHPLLAPGRRPRRRPGGAGRHYQSPVNEKRLPLGSRRRADVAVTGESIVKAPPHTAALPRAGRGQTGSCTRREARRWLRPRPGSSS